MLLANLNACLLMLLGALYIVAGLFGEPLPMLIAGHVEGLAKFQVGTAVTALSIAGLWFGLRIFPRLEQVRHRTPYLAGHGALLAVNATLLCGIWASFLARGSDKQDQYWLWMSMIDLAPKVALLAVAGLILIFSAHPRRWLGR